MKAAAAHDEDAAVLEREVGRRMAERLDFVRLAPARIADIGLTSDDLDALRRRYPNAQSLAVSPAPQRLAALRTRSGWLERLRGRSPRAVAADAAALPLAADALDLAWSNLHLHWHDEPAAPLRELQRALAVGGLLMFSVFGPDTLKELRAACREAGVAPPLRNFSDMHDLGDLLVEAGFADPVMDMETIALTYASPRGFLRDQRLLGTRAALLGRLGWRDWRRVLAAWGARREAGRVTATFEIVYGHAWKAAPRTVPDGRAIVAFKRG